MPDIAFLNGTFMPLAEARVSVEDRGFQFGDGVYEVVRTYGGNPFQLDAHLARLLKSAHELDLRCPYDISGWKAIIAEGLARAAYAESKIYLQLTRGVAPRDHLYPPVAVNPTGVMTVRELHPLDRRLQETGVAAITLEDLRWGRCDIKSLNLLPNVMARQRASEAGVFEAIFVRGQQVTEGSVCNVMMVRDGGQVMTPPEGPTILSGVTRHVVLQLATAAGLTAIEEPVSLDDLRQATEVFLTGTTIEVLPVIQLDGKPVGCGGIGATTKRLLTLFRDASEHASLLHR